MDGYYTCGMPFVKEILKNSLKKDFPAGARPRNGAAVGTGNSFRSTPIKPSRGKESCPTIIPYRRGARPLPGHARRMTISQEPFSRTRFAV